MFINKREPDCSCCKYGYVLSNGHECVCERYGVIERKNKCRVFTYDPLKRIPNKPPKAEKFSKEDFEVN